MENEKPTIERARERRSGLAIPLGAIRTRGRAIGEFADLGGLAAFCAASGLGIIQILPVNDSGADSSPYSALSAFALNPVYLRVEDISGYDSSPRAAKLLKGMHRSSDAPGAEKFDYQAVRTAKDQALRCIYEEKSAELGADRALAKWVEENPWVKTYAVFMALKEKHRQASWKEWPAQDRDALTVPVEQRWNDGSLQKAHLFYAWVQMHADTQFAAASAQAAGHGVILKGDIPIMMAEDSADVWANPRYFDQTLRAGAPPDMYSDDGQNWGFPVYRWENLAADGYRWWKDRLRSAARYYGAFRIDHILGFFRIWETGEHETAAAMGRTDPLVPITGDELHQAGFDEGRVTWLSTPHVPTGAVQEANNGDYLGTHGLLSTMMDRVGDEELWRFKKTIRGERDILEANLPPSVKAVLAKEWRNRVLIPLAAGGVQGEGGGSIYSVAWLHERSRAWQSLSGDERTALEKLFAQKDKQMEQAWEDHARSILGPLTETTAMIPCAEDLGVNLKCLPQVLSDLGILSLRVLRWARDWAKPGQPFQSLASYPPLSVTATSVHDSSTVREWWEREGGGKDMIAAFKPRKSLPPEEYTTECAAWLLETAASSKSVFCIHPIQDYLALVSAYRPADPQAERINIPGTVCPGNWTYRLPMDIAVLLADKDLQGKIQNIAEKHRR